MTSRHTQAEILKLARLLDVGPEDLAYLEAVDAESLRALREQATEHLFAADRRHLQSLAAASAKLPGALVAKMAQHVFGPLLSARVAGLLESRHAIDLARHLPPHFLAEIGIHIDPRQVVDVLASMPPDRVVTIARELAARKEHVAMGRFVGHMPDDAILAAIDVLADGDLLRTAFVIEGDGALERVLALLPHDRVAGVLCAAVEEDLWSEGVELVHRVPEERRAELAAAAAALDDRVVDALLVAALDEERLDAAPPPKAKAKAKAKAKPKRKAAL